MNFIEGILGSNRAPRGTNGLADSFLKQKLSKIKEYGKKNLSPKRYQHSRRVAKVCELYARQFGLDPLKACIAGFGHDIAREWDAKKTLAFLEKRHLEVEDFLKKKPVLLHGLVARHLLSEKFDVADPEILEAVEHHTLGFAGACDLALLLFVADYAEPGRKFTTLSWRRSLRVLPLPCRVKKVIEHSRERYNDVHPRTEALYGRMDLECSDCGQDEPLKRVFSDERA